MSAIETAAQVFEAHRDHLVAVAYRMLGSRADAEDAVQEAWLRWDATDQAEVRDPKGWLTTVTARLCLDQLRSARVRREAYVGQWLPEPVVDRLPAAGAGGDGLAADPADQAARADEVSYALLVVLERLTPEQRVVFVLHDVFAMPFDEIAQVLGTTPGAARQLASRARRAIGSEEPPRHTADLAEQRRVVAAFLDAAATGDMDRLLEALAPDVVAIGDGGGVVPAGLHPIVGPVQVARFITGLFRRYGQGARWLHLEPVLLNGDLGVLVEAEQPDGEHLRGVMALVVADGRIARVFNQVNPAKLERVPARDPSRALHLPAIG